MAGRGLSVSDYAKKRGISRQAVLKAINDGRLKKSIKKDEKNRYEINARLADKEWSKNTAEGVGAPSHIESKASKKADQGKKVERQERQQTEKEDKLQDTEPDSDANSCPRGFNQSRAWNEYYKSEKARIEYEKSAGLLVRVEEVEQLWARIISETKNKIMAIPSKAKSRIPRLTIEEIEILEALQREALDELIDGM
ncbi:MAG: hypothetical protein V4525_11025 [Pseudomonadota bacterium]